MKLLKMIVSLLNKELFLKREIDNLRSYVSECYPTVNQRLRKNQDGSCLTFDSLFKVGSIPQLLIRLLPNEDVHTQQNTFIDPGYLSCTSELDSFISHVVGDNIACLQFIIPKNSLILDVHALLPECNEENEYILPRGQKYRVDLIKVFSGKKEIAVFLKEFKSCMSVHEICDSYNIKSIHLYRLSKK